MSETGTGADVLHQQEDFVLSERAMADLAKDANLPDRSVLDLILNYLHDEKADGVVLIDLRGKSSEADHMVVASGRSTRHVVHLSENLTRRLKAACTVAPRVEGKSAGDWVLIDAGDVIIHIFRPEVREFYQLEKMWQSPAET